METVESNEGEDIADNSGGDEHANELDGSKRYAAHHIHFAEDTIESPVIEDQDHM